ncbi:alpha/beta hydrolase [Paucisalibacillus sp. EB02]|uniref:alpha/beta hydrolase n=1 Tax=Paucisalibacillus sp. EB02 TaxID=1347087 RepID=UPI0004B5098C|nr:alpha/beta hydrolase [Paucisalibacillus sp. EB02]
MRLKLEKIDINYNLYNSPKKNTEYIVLIHGLGLDSTMWDPLIPYLQEYYHILTFDLRGHGTTKGQTDHITWDLLIEDFHTLQSELRLEKFHLVGLGFGGNLAIKFNETYPEKVKKLILTSTYMYFPEVITQKELQKRKNLVTDGNMSELTKNMIHQIVYNLTPETEFLLLMAYAKVEQTTYFNLLKMLAETVKLDDLRHIDKEVLLIQGDKDPLFPTQQNNLYQNYLKNSVNYIVPNSSNLVPLDNPSSFITLVGHFIKEGINGNFNAIMEQEFTNNYEDLLLKPFNTFEINILNGFSVKYKGVAVEGKWNQRKAKNLLAYLAYHNPSTREDLIEEFWRENDLNSAKNNLRVALNHLKRILQKHNLESHLQIGRDQISLVGDISFDLSNYMHLLQVCSVEINPIRKKALFDELSHLYQERMFLDMYDDWLLSIQQEIDIRIHAISKLMKKR